MSTKPVSAALALVLAASAVASAQETVDAYWGRTVAPNSGQKLHFSVWGANDVEVSTYRLPTNSLGDYLRPNGLHVDTSQLTASKTEMLGGQRGQVDAATRPGVYLYVARGQGGQTNGRLQAQAVVVSDLKIAAKRDDDSSLLLIQRGQDLSSARVEIYAGANRQSPMTLLRQTRVRGGIGFLRTSSTDNLVYVARYRNHVAIQSAYSRTWRANRDAFTVHVQTDRPLYRAGHEVEFKATVRERINGSLATPNDEEVRVHLRDPRGGRARIATLRTNEYGTVSGSTTLSESAALGGYTLEVEVGAPAPATGPASGPVVFGRASFSVEAYRKPEFKVELAGLEKQIVQGQALEGEISARYFFGAPVADAEVTYTVRRRNRWRWWNPWIRPILFDAMPSLWYPTWRDEHVGSFSGRTDSQGTLAFSVPTTRTDYDADYEVTATVTDASRREVKGGGSVAVTRAAFDLLLNTNRYAFEPGDLIELRANLATVGGTPAPATPVTFEIAALDKDGNATPRLSRTRVSDAAGEAQLRLRARTQNRYRITARASDADGNEITATREIWIADDTGLHNWGTNQVEIISDKDVYEAGDTALILVRGPASATRGVITVEGRDIRRAYGLQLNGGLALFSLPIDASMTPNAFISVLLPGEEQSLTAQKKLEVPPVQNIVDVTVVADKAEYRPGETATFFLKATDYQGNPVQAELALGVVDEALFALREDATASMHDTFFPQIGSGVDTIGARGSWSRGGIGFPGGPVFALESATVKTAAGPGASSPSKVREFFPDTMTWLAHVETNAQGEATISQAMADSLTTWRLTARAVTKRNDFGQTKTTALVRKDLIVRLATPRALVEGDELELTAIVHNLAPEGTPNSSNARVGLRLDVAGVELLDGADRVLRVRRDGEGEASFKVRVKDAKEARLEIRGTASFDDDALRLRLPIAARGVAAPETWSGSQVGSGTLRFSLTKAPGAIENASELELSLAPSLAGTLLDSVEYLAGYPYGCIEQTMSRFMPTLLVQETLDRLGRKDPKLESEIPKMVKTGIEKLRGHQNADGGFGWFGTHGTSHPYVSAYVVYGLALAKQQGHDSGDDVLAKAVAFLKDSLASASNTDLTGRSYQVFALAEAGEDVDAELVRLAAQKSQLGEYGVAVLTLAAKRRNQGSLASDLLAELGRSAVRLNGRAHWAGNTLRYGNWASNPVEATAYALRAYLEVDPQNALVSESMGWLLSQRRPNGQYVTTKDTAAVVLAFAHYVKHTGELNPRFNAIVEVNGQVVATERFMRDDLTKEPKKITIPGRDLRSGANEVVIRMSGSGALYASGLLTQFVRMSPITAADAGLSVRREYQVVSERIDNDGNLVEDVSPFTGRVKVGDTLRVTVTMDPSQAGDVEHVNLEDRFPSGFEVKETERRDFSWWTPWRTAKEVHDDRVVFFASRLRYGVSSGTRSYSYDLRAETPGTFLALPAYAEAVYTPGVHGRSGAVEVVIED